jgi:mono/diheme cytochrome c family protein
MNRRVPLLLLVALAACVGPFRRAHDLDEPPSETYAQMVATGDSIFHRRACSRCHGPDAKGTRAAPSLLGPSFLHVTGGYSDFVRIITSGVPLDSIKDKTHTLDMQPRGGRQNPLSDSDIRSVAAYVYSLSHPRAAR